MPHFVYSSVDRYHLLAIVNSAAGNIGVQIFPWVLVFDSFEYTPSIGIAIILCLTFEKAPTLFPSGCIPLHCHQQLTGVPILQ